MASPAGADPVGLLMAGQSCPDTRVAADLVAPVRRAGRGPLSGAHLAAAVARARAARALTAARMLYTRTNFAGCISLLSITEQELGRNLADAEPESTQKAHRLLARVNFWLGVCQWAAGDPQTAAASFVRAAQLPSSPTPDRRLLPPGVLQHYRQAISSPREEVSCTLAANVNVEELLVDGQGPTVKGRTLRVSAGTHYLVLHSQCAGGVGACQSGPRSLRLEGKPLGCRVTRPDAAPAGPPVVCISGSEAADAGFVADVIAEAQVDGILVAALTKRGIALRFGMRGRHDFARQVSSTLPDDGSAAVVLARSVDLLLTEGTRGPPERPPGPPNAWYRKWWVWALVGTGVVAVAVTGVALSSGSDRVTVVFK